MTDHDHGYKRMFSHPEMIRDLLIGFVREPWIADPRLEVRFCIHRRNERLVE